MNWVKQADGPKDGTWVIGLAHLQASLEDVGGDRMVYPKVQWRDGPSGSGWYADDQVFWGAAISYVRPLRPSDET
jgi:hypothetical protein